MCQPLTAEVQKTLWSEKRHQFARPESWTWRGFSVSLMDKSAEQRVLCLLHLRISRRYDTSFCFQSQPQSLQDHILEFGGIKRWNQTLKNIISGNFQVGPQPRQRTYSPPSPPIPLLPPPQRAYFEHLIRSQEQHSSCQVRELWDTPRHRPT